MEAKHFIILDITNTVRVNERASWNANVQFVYPANRDTSFDIKAIMNRFGRTLKLEEKRKQVLTITLNHDADYKTHHFR